MFSRKKKIPIDETYFETHIPDVDFKPKTNDIYYTIDGIISEGFGIDPETKIMINLGPR